MSKKKVSKSKSIASKAAGDAAPKTLALSPGWIQFIKNLGAYQITQDDPASIVADVLVHFGAGYGAERLRDTASVTATFSPIFKKPTDLSAFHSMLLASTIKHLPSFNWSTNAPLRDQIRGAAFAHGVLARQQVVLDGTITLSIDQILTTLRGVQATHCATPGGAGGGIMCDF